MLSVVLEYCRVKIRQIRLDKIHHSVPSEELMTQNFFIHTVMRLCGYQGCSLHSLDADSCVDIV